MKTEFVMDEGEEEKESSVSAQTLENEAENPNVPEAPSPIATSLLDRFFASSLATKIASGVFGALSLGSAAAAHADKIATNQAAADAFAGQTPGPTVDKIVSPEQQTLTEYSVKEFSISGGRIAALVETADGKTKVGIGDIDASGNLVLKEAGSLPFAVLDVRVSEANPNLMVAVGDKVLRAEQGQFGVSKDGGKTWEVKETGGRTAFRSFFTPDNKYVYILEADSYQENMTAYRRIDLTSGASVQEVKTVSTSPDAPVYPVRLSTQLMATSQPDTYFGYGTSGPHRGYFKVTFYPNGTMITERFHEDEGFTEGNLIMYQDQGKNWLWLVSNHTIAIDNPNLPRGTIYINADDVKQFEVQPKFSVIDEFMVTVGAAVPDLKSGIGYMGSNIMFSVDNRYVARVEGFALTAPDDINQRVLLSQNGWLAPQKDDDSVQITGLDIVETAGKKFLVAGLSRQDKMYDPAENTGWWKASGGGILVQDITGGVSREGVWRQATFQGLFRTFLPLATRNFGKGW